VLIGDRTLRYDPTSYFVYVVETPPTGHVINVSAARPYLAIGFTLDVQAIAALLIDLEPTVDGSGFATHPVNDDLLDALRQTQLGHLTRMIGRVRITVVLDLLQLVSALVLAVILFRLTKMVDATVAMLAMTFRVGEGILDAAPIPAIPLSQFCPAPCDAP
jgi:hypothetical protein